MSRRASSYHVSPSQPLCQVRAPAVSSPPRACRARRLPSASQSHARVTSFLSLLPRRSRVPAVPSFSPLRVRRVSAWVPCSQSFPDSRQSAHDAFQRGPQLSLPRSIHVPAVSFLANHSATRQPAGPSCRPLLLAANESTPRVLSIANFRWKLMRWIRQLSLSGTINSGQNEEAVCCFV